MKIAVVFMALFAVALAVPAQEDAERLLSLQPLDAETADMLQNLMNDPNAVAFFQSNAELQQLFKQALGAEDLFRETAEKERCLLLLSWLLLLSRISVTTTSG